MQNKYSDSTLTINLDAIRHNYNFYKNIAGSSICSSVVKADAYGLGIEEIAPTFEGEGCENFFVANLDEAIKLRSIISKDRNIHVFHGVKKGEEKIFENYDLIPVLNDFYQIEVWADHSLNLGTKQPCLIHIDTGMNRLGFNYSESVKLQEGDYFKKLDVKYIMTHLACAPDVKHPLNKKQLKEITSCRNLFPNTPISFASSKGSLLGEDYIFDMIRAGSGLYGVKGRRRQELETKHVINLKSKILQIRKVDRNGTVGYGAVKNVKKGDRLAVVPIGYADGYFRCLGDKFYGYYKNTKIPIVGRVSMDMTVFDISKIPENQINVGDEITLIGDELNIDIVAEAANTIGYEVLTNLGSRYKRLYT